LLFRVSPIKLLKSIPNQVVKIYSAYSTFVNTIFFMCEDLAGEENALGRFLKEEGKSDKTR
jgi:hypothetical protein